eukprot:1691639-Pyramimonas_sp.AAC.1
MNNLRYEAERRIVTLETGNWNWCMVLKSDLSSLMAPQGGQRINRIALACYMSNYSLKAVTCYMFQYMHDQLHGFVPLGNM